MPHSTFKCRPTWMDTGVVKCPCGQTFNYELDRERDMKLQMHKKFCDKWLGTKFTSRPRKAMMTKERQHTIVEIREFNTYAAGIGNNSLKNH